MRLGIVIVQHNVRDLLHACLRSLDASVTPFAFDVCVVDTGTDGSAAMVRAEFPHVTVIEASDNPGYAAANNVGLRRVRGEYRLLLNPDTELPPDALAQAVAMMDGDPTIGVLGPKLVRADGSLDLACRRSFPTPRNALFHYLRLPRAFPHVPLFGEYNLTYRDPDQEYDVDSVVGAFMLLRLAALERTGLLDESFWMYGEDLDLCWRINRAGWRTHYCPRIVVRHYKGQSSTGRRSLRRTYEFFRAMHVFYRKHYAPASPPALNALVTAGIAGLAAAALLAECVRPPAPARAG